MKRLIIFILLLTLLFTLPLDTKAASLPRIVDEADLLTIEEETYLESRASKLANAYDMDVVILTINSLENQKSEAYADNYYDENGYGIGSDYSGVLFLLSMEYRDWAISTCGDAIYALTDYGIQQVFYAAAEYLSEDRYFEAFDAYLYALEQYFSAYSLGSPLDGIDHDYDGPGTYIPGTVEDIIYYDRPYTRNAGWYIKKFIISLAIGAIVAGLVHLIMRNQMNTAKAQRDAGYYVNNGSARITSHQDIFLYSSVQRTKRQQSNSGGGGSSVHMSSGGRSHGGGHGKF